MVSSGSLIVFAPHLYVMAGATDTPMHLWKNRTLSVSLSVVCRLSVHMTVSLSVRLSFNTYVYLNIAALSTG